MDHNELRILGKVIYRAWEEPDFRARLVSEPRQVLVDAGFAIRDDVTVTVKEGDTGLPYKVSDTEVVLPLPEPPEDLSDLEDEEDEIAKADLDDVTGGWSGSTGGDDIRFASVGNWLTRTHSINDATIGHVASCCW